MSSAEKDEWMIVDQVMDSSNFDFTLGGELEDDVVDVEEVELGGNFNPPVSTNADVIDVQDAVVEVGQNTKNRLKRKVPPRAPKPKNEPEKSYRSPYWDHLNDIKEDESILRIRDVVRYVRSSPQRMETFNKCVEKDKIKSKQTMCLDVCSRWNSTYLMLEVAIKFEKAFQRIGEEDSSFIKIFGIKEGEEDLSLHLEGLGGSHRISVPTPRQPTVPNKLDWKKYGLFVTFLKKFSDATKKFPASLFVTSNMFFHELYEVQVKIDELIANRDPYMSSMAIEMKRKFESFAIPNPKGRQRVRKLMEKKVKDVLNRLYDSYAKEGEVRQHVSSASQMPRVENENCDSRLNLAMEFDTYLEEEYSSVCSLEVKSENFKAMREKQLEMQHTMSRKGYAWLTAELKAKRKVDSISRAVVWANGHRDKDGKPKNENVAQKIEDMRKIERNGQNSNNLKEDAVSKVLGAERNGCVRTFGKGVTQTRLTILSQMKGQFAELREENGQMKSQMSDMQNTIDELKKSQVHNPETTEAIPTTPIVSPSPVTNMVLNQRFVAGCEGDSLYCVLSKVCCLMLD
ncbi:hypothetical protein RHSIM_Rhsim05G0198600 [Rhododendron simsii]|uniref:hAT-like transposase RNase-H fold domain-containing protein n=1 Tax=Rhododendron simsii TaxID=118357 RepID=A0A834LPQ8_RHOSS|nr:hypothetical protein RHSIM_Rhsim05G0198600 [Rhododendron simsii]